MLTDYEINAIAEKVAEIVERRSRKALSLVDAAAAIGISKSQLYVQIGDGNIKTFHIGKRHFVTREEVERFLNEKADQ